MQTLRDLAAHGLSAVEGGRLPNLVLWCEDECEGTGESWYCFVGQALESLNSWWLEHDERLPRAIWEEIDELTKAQLPNVLGGADRADAARLARIFRDELRLLLVGPSEWERRGYAS
jgi:hypothetical protein